MHEGLICRECPLVEEVNGDVAMHKCSINGRFVNQDDSCVVETNKLMEIIHAVSKEMLLRTKKVK